MSTTTAPKPGAAKTVTTSITIRPETRRALRQIAAEMAANDRRKVIGMGEVVESLLEPIFLRRGISINGTDDTDAAD